MLSVPSAPPPTRLDAIEHQLVAYATADLDDAELTAAARHHLAGGARRRAAIALELGDRLALAERSTDAIACGVELLHAASLVHDDLQDGARTRRGVASVAAGFGEDAALLLGDVLIAAAFEATAALSARGRNPSPASRLRRAVTATACGQHREREGRHGFDLEGYVAVAADKSAPLFALPFELALAEAGLTAAIPRARRAAQQFAVGYQLRDDLDDVAADAAGGEANAVLVLDTDGRQRARARATVARRARTHLDDAAAIARRLPHGAGAPLLRLSAALGQELEGSWT